MLFPFPRLCMCGEKLAVDPHIYLKIEKREKSHHLES